MGPDKKRFEHWKKKYNGITFHKNANAFTAHKHRTKQQGGHARKKNGDLHLTVAGPEDKVNKVAEEIVGFVGVPFRMPRPRALQLIDEQNRINKERKKTLIISNKQKTNDVGQLEQLEKEYNEDPSVRDNIKRSNKGSKTTKRVSKNY